MLVQIALISLVENERPLFIKGKKNTRGVDLEIMLTALGYDENGNDDAVIAKTNKQTNKINKQTKKTPTNNTCMFLLW